jgi:hypothetical protein
MASFVASNEVEPDEIGSWIGVELNPFARSIDICNWFGLRKNGA